MLMLGECIVLQLPDFILNHGSHGSNFYIFFLLVDNTWAYVWCGTWIWHSSVLWNAGLLDRASRWDFMKIAILLFFCAVQNHGSKLLFSLSSIVQHTAYPPFGFSILKAGLNKSVLLSVYASPTARDSSFNNSLHGIITSKTVGIWMSIVVFFRIKNLEKGDILAWFKT